MIANKKEFGGGLLLMLGFWGVFILLLSPVFNGVNGLDYMDNLYNSISKTSAYYIPATQEKVRAFEGKNISVTIKAKSVADATRMAGLLRANGAMVEERNEELAVSGDLGLLLGRMLEDADAMFHNNGATVAGKYGYNEKQALYDWWSIGKEMDSALKKQELFKEAKVVYDAQYKALEPAYNYYGIQAESIRNKMGTVVFSLVGYVIYTLWFGFAILFMFEGWGLKLEH